MSGKLYLITRADLRHGAQAAQLVHGMASFARDFPQEFSAWERTSNTVVCLTVRDERELSVLLERATVVSCGVELSISTFREPDLEDQLTCIVLGPTDAASELCVGLPLACR